MQTELSALLPHHEQQQLKKTKHLYSPQNLLMGTGLQNTATTYIKQLKTSINQKPTP